MASATAFVLLGTPHQNDNGINPEWLIELWEGNVARWAARHLGGSQANLVSEPSSPEDIGAALVRFILQLTENRSGRLSVVVSALPDSSMLRHMNCVDGLRGADVHVLIPSYTRTVSAWSGELHESGRIQAGETEN